MPALPRGSELLGYESEAPTPLMPWLLTAALALILADMIAVLALLGGNLLGGLLRPRPSATAMLVRCRRSGPRPQPLAHSCVRADQHPSANRAPAEACSASAPTPSPKSDRERHARLRADGRRDNRRKPAKPASLACRAFSLSARPSSRAIPIGVDIVNDEISFFPVLYWPVIENAKPLPQPALAKIDAYMKQGGMIIFDTRDANTGLPSGTRLQGRGTSALQRLLGSLDVPRLEPVPEDHVLTKSFYLLRTFPGRWDNGALWVEAGAGSEGDGRKARRADGVTSIMVTSNDFASAWALDASGRPLYPVVPGGEDQREMALRTGINIVMHALTGNYKADQVHVPALLERLGQ